MENQVIQFDIDLGVGKINEDTQFVNHDHDHDHVDFDVDIDVDVADEDTIHWSDVRGTGLFSVDNWIPDGELDLEPYEGMEFETEEAAKAFYNSYARRVGFGTRVNYSRRARKDGAIIRRSFVCAKEGFRKLDDKRTMDREVKRARTVTRVGCKAALSVKMHEESGKWVVYNFVKDHNHDLVPPDQVHCLRSHRQISGPAKTLIDTLQAAGMGPHRIMSALIKEYGGIGNVGFTEVDCKNYMRNNRQKSVGGDIQFLLEYLRKMQANSPSFFYAVHGDEDSSTGNVFWANPKARDNYAYFSDTVTFDTTYRSNRYRLPFAFFTGVNHHGQPVLFGCAFLVNESEASLVWLFETWLSAMSGCPPVSITTDYDPVIRAAIMHAFPESRHRFCKWHILKKSQEKLSHVFLKHPSFEADFHKCVNLTDTIEEFETCWSSLVDKYDLRGHEWLQCLYSARSQWVPLYLRDTFFAEVFITQRSDSINSYFDGYINASTTLNQFFELYEKALDSRNEKEIKADYDCINTLPILKTPSPMEKQASELYTRKLFTRFQEELVWTLTFMASKVEDDGQITTYQVSKFGEDNKGHCVRFNVLDMRVSCSCQMFEFSGILCRHVLTVFKVTNILKLPFHYILKRWTRNAKSSVMLESHGTDSFSSYLESHIVRYNLLRHEALKLVNKGAGSLDSYNAAMAALEEATEKVVSATKSDGKVPNGCIRGESVANGAHVNHCTNDHKHLPKDDMDRRISELTRELERANKKSDVYHTNLVTILKEIDAHRQQLSIQVNSIKLNMLDDL